MVFYHREDLTNLCIRSPPGSPKRGIPKLYLEKLNFEEDNIPVGSPVQAVRARGQTGVVEVNNYVYKERNVPA
jgi:hypothetical protein